MWRLHIAAQAMREGRDNVAAIAERVGYRSEEAFSRAFKRQFGSSPAAWRKCKLEHLLSDSLPGSPSRRIQILRGP